MEDQDRKTPEEEAEVEGHALDELSAKDEPSDDVYAKDDNEVEAHALRDELADEVS